MATTAFEFIRERTAPVEPVAALVEPSAITPRRRRPKAT